MIKFQEECIFFVVIRDSVVTKSVSYKTTLDQWMYNELRMSSNVINNTIRGYMLYNQIQFYTNIRYQVSNLVGDAIITKAKLKLASLYGLNYDNFVTIGNYIYYDSLKEDITPILMYEYNT